MATLLDTMLHAIGCQDMISTMGGTRWSVTAFTEAMVSHQALGTVRHMCPWQPVNNVLMCSIVVLLAGRL